MLHCMIINLNFGTHLLKSQDDVSIIIKFYVEIFRKRKLICCAGERRDPLALLFVIS